jgi:hypothetical protein
MGASTRVRVKPGEAVAIAGVTETSDSRGAGFPPSARAESGATDSAMVVRVTPFESSYDSVPAARER